jgi:hypothetical protein
LVGNDHGDFTLVRAVGKVASLANKVAKVISADKNFSV